MVRTPHFLLFVEATTDVSSEERLGYWHFALEALDNEESLEAKDQETDSSLERLELLGLVRGLEALDQPSRVTLVSASAHLNRGLRNGLPLWRDNNWEWERFGEMAPVRDRDLWQRVDHALQFHQLQSRLFRLDAAHSGGPPRPHFSAPPTDPTIAPPQANTSRTEQRPPSTWLDRLRVAAGRPSRGRRPLAIGA